MDMVHMIWIISYDSYYKIVRFFAIFVANWNSEKLISLIYRNHTKLVISEEYHIYGIRQSATMGISALNIPKCRLSSFITTKLDRLYCGLYVRDTYMIIYNHSLWWYYYLCNRFCCIYPITVSILNTVPEAIVGEIIIIDDFSDDKNMLLVLDKIDVSISHLNGLNNDVLSGL